MHLPTLLLASGLFTLGTFACAADTPATQAVNPLEKLRDRNRVLIIFAADGSDAKLQEQRRQASRDVGGYAERDLTVFEVVGDNAVRDGQPLPTGTAAALRRAVSGEAFSVVLIGKDGGVKLREREPIENAKLFATIDAMPMRQHERDER